MRVDDIIADYVDYVTFDADSRVLTICMKDGKINTVENVRRRDEANPDGTLAIFFVEESTNITGFGGSTIGRVQDYYFYTSAPSGYYVPTKKGLMIAGLLEYDFAPSQELDDFIESLVR